MKKLLSLILTFALTLSIITLFPTTAYADTTGHVGNCSWRLDGTRLIISGNGSMSDINTIPSYNWGKNITELIINEGVTTIGIGAFMDCKQLKTVSLPSSLKQIDKFAFYNCNSLIEIIIPGISRNRLLP